MGSKYYLHFGRKARNILCCHSMLHFVIVLVAWYISLMLLSKRPENGLLLIFFHAGEAVLHIANTTKLIIL